MKWLAWLLRRRRRDPELLSQMGYIQLIIGDTAAAAVSFRQVGFLKQHCDAHDNRGTRILPCKGILLCQSKCFLK